MYKIIETKSYLKKLKKFLKKHPDIFAKYEKTIYLLELNPHHPSLRLHKLSGKLAQYYFISIDMSYRIIIDFVIIEDQIILIDIGSHSEVY
jgi:addiction module RelE/StbE family toxin